MKENFVAIGLSSLYSEYKGGNIMPDGAVKTPEHKRLEAEEHRKDADFVRRLGNHESDAVDQRKRLQSLLEGGFHKDVKLPQGLAEFLDSGKLPNIPNQFPIPPIERVPDDQKLRKHVIEHAGGATMVEGNQLIQLLKKETAEQALKELGFGDVKLPESWDSMDVLHRAQWLADKQEIFSTRQLGSAKERELVLPAIGGGSGEIYWNSSEPTMEVDQEDRQDPFTGEIIKGSKLRTGVEETIMRLVILHELSGKPFDIAPPGKSVDEQLKELTDHLKLNFLDKVDDAWANKRNFDVVNELATVGRDLSRKYELAGVDKNAVFEKVLPFAERDKIREVKMKLDKYFQEISDKEPLKYKELFRVIDEESTQVNKMQDSGLYGKALRQRADFKRVAKKEIEKAVTAEEGEMLRWKAVRLEEGFDLRYGETDINQPPGDWRDSEFNLDKILRSLESTDFNEQQLQNSLNAAVRIVMLIPINTLEGEEKDRAERLKLRLEEKLQAILAVNSFHAVMEQVDMDPEKILGVFGHLKDDTFQTYFERFSKDSKGHTLFLDDKEGEPDDEREKLNLLSVGMNLYMRRLHHERRIMNFVEKWTRNAGVKPGKAEDGLEAECLAAIADIEKRTGGSRDVSVIKNKVTDWYSENTLLGAHEKGAKYFRKEEMVGDTGLVGSVVGKSKAQHDAWKAKRVWNEGLVEELIKNQKDWGLLPEQIKEMVDSGMIDQVMNNAQRLSWMMAWSDYDGIRIWDPNTQNPAGGRGRQVAYVYNQSTHMFHGRMIDHIWDFYIDEKRGEVPKTNFIMQDELLGERGNFLPQNRSMVRFAGSALGDDVVAAFVADKIRGMKNINKLDLNNGDEMDMIRAAALGEGIDSGEISFDKTDWAKFFDGKSSWKYRWIDLYGDRKASKDMFGDPTQSYLEGSNTEAFFELFSKKFFYSKRMAARLKPMMKQVMPAHMRIGNYWKEWWGEPFRMHHSEKEAMVDFAVRTNRMDVQYKDFMKRRYLGWGGVPGVMPVRGVRQLSEAADVFTREFTTGVPKNSWMMPLAWGNAFFGQGMKYVFS